MSVKVIIRDTEREHESERDFNYLFIYFVWQLAFEVWQLN